MKEQRRRRTPSQGKCALCGNTFGKAAMSRHLEKCLPALPEKTGPAARRAAKTGRLLHLVAEGRYLPQYWMHLQAPADATLGVLDSFLRRTWLECCGHLSAFTIDGRTYAWEPLDDPFEGLFGESGERDRSMDVRMGRVLRPTMKFHYEYDFGSTTELVLRVMGERRGPLRRGAIQLLARNDPPAILCEACGAPAVKVCAFCAAEGTGWLCDRCAKQHKCEDHAFLPVVNSPRVGVCAYTG